jgi:hypothetical protein
MTMATETREHFRERLGRIGYAALNDEFDEEAIGVGWKTQPDSFREDHIRAAEAVYAQALRDVVDLFDRRVEEAESEEYAADLHACLTVIHFAQDLGIELKEGE